MLGRIRDINPDQIVFVGRQLAKKEIVEYLSALSRTAHVRVVIGSDANGDNQLYHPESPLRSYYFTQLCISYQPLASQALVALNSRTGEAIAYMGNYPFDVSEASKTEYFMMELRGKPALAVLDELQQLLVPAS